MALAVVTRDEDPGAPLWWVRRLHARLIDRASALRTVWRYYRGDFEWKYADKDLRRVFGHVFYQSRVGINWMALVCSAPAQRLQVEGFRVGGAKEADPAAWDIWQHANLDEQSRVVHDLSILFGVSYATVWLREDDSEHPRITVEHPATCAIESDPRDRQERLAGLRTYVDAFGYQRAELFLPDAMYAWRSETPAPESGYHAASAVQWIPDEEIVEGGMMANPAKAVPIVEFANAGQVSWPGEDDGAYLAQRSELHPVIPIQDAINNLLRTALIAANFQGYRQRWGVGLQVDRDAETGKPLQPFESGPSHIWAVENPEAKLGEFGTTDIGNLMQGIDDLVRYLAAVGQLPPHLLNSQADRLSGESIRAAESSLVAKVRAKQAMFGGAWEEVMRVAGRLSDNAALAQAHGSETMWGDPETQTLAQLYDAALKAAQVGVPWQAIMEMLDYTPEQISRMRVDRASEALTASLNAPPPAPGRPPAPPPLPPA